jgi:hypothetical protein
MRHIADAADCREWSETAVHPWKKPLLVSENVFKRDELKVEEKKSVENIA